MDHPYGWLSVVPPLATVAIALATRRVLLSLLLGLFAGALTLRGGDLGQSIFDLCEVHLWASLIDPTKLRVLGFTLMMGAMIGLLNAGGGMQGLVRLIAPLTHDARSGQLTTWLLGLIVFFDDYTNTLLLGSAMRPTFDRLRLSREKLAYIVDSTAATVACLAPMSVWVAFELECIRDGLENTRVPGASELTPLSLFLACLPYRFYVILALALVVLVAVMRRDFGPMARAEQRARTEGSAPLTEEEEGPSPRVTHWSNALAPILVTLGTVLVLIYATGRSSLAAADNSPTLWQIVGAADSVQSLFYGALVGLMFSATLLRARGVLTGKQVRDAAFFGVRTVIPALAILWLAGTMSRMTGSKDVSGTVESTPYEFKEHRLYTGQYLTSLLPTADSESASAVSALLPVTVFLLACLISFSTGTSFGTMGILMPVVTPVAITAATGADGVIDAGSPLLLASIGSVLAGAIFGDHCSPISDTTILSSQASGCDHMAHVVTQMPYAIAAGVASAGAIVAIGLRVNVWVALLLSFLALIAVLRVLGQRVEDAVELPPEAA